MHTLWEVFMCFLRCSWYFCCWILFVYYHEFNRWYRCHKEQKEQKAKKVSIIALFSMSLGNYQNFVSGVTVVSGVDKLKDFYRIWWHSKISNRDLQGNCKILLKGQKRKKMLVLLERVSLWQGLRLLAALYFYILYILLYIILCIIIYYLFLSRPVSKNLLKQIVKCGYSITSVYVCFNDVWLA